MGLLASLESGQLPRLLASKYIPDKDQAAAKLAHETCHNVGAT
jgi:hypothetical protein